MQAIMRFSYSYSCCNTRCTYWGVKRYLHQISTKSRKIMGNETVPRRAERYWGKETVPSSDVKDTWGMKQTQNADRRWGMKLNIYCTSVT